MANLLIEPGEYVIEGYSSKSVLDFHDGKAYRSPYTMARSQVWNVQPTSGDLWTIQNVLSQQYLGLRSFDSAANRPGLYEVAHGFPWRLEKHPDWITMLVPYTNYCIDSWNTDSYPGAELVMWKSKGGWNQKWVFSKEVDPFLEDGAVYSIINMASGTAIELNEAAKACGHALRTNSTSQHFQAIETSAGWAFKQVNRNLCLGLCRTTLNIGKGDHVHGVGHEFPWMVVPASTLGEERGAFKIFVPYGGNLMNLEDGNAGNGTKVEIRENGEQKCRQWRFERVETTPRGPIVGERATEL